MSFACAFTLVELLVVITVIAVLTGVMVAEMGGTYEDALLRTNARKLIDVCDAASNRAIAAQQAQVLKIDAASGHFAVRAKAREIDEKEAFLTEGDLDQRIGLKIREPAHVEDSDADESEQSEQPTELGTVMFYPDGSADAREFTFRDRAGVEVVLRINPTTSRVRIVEMAEQ
jgi:type II secretion system protein H